MIETYGSISSSPGKMGFTIHNSGFQHYNLEKIYIPFKVPADALGDAVAGIRALGVKGIGVSSPHKRSVIPYLQNMDEITSRSRSCNTNLNIDDNLLGFNTDYYAIKSLISEIDILMMQKNIVLCGNGGYASTAKIVFHDMGINIHKEITRNNWEDLNDIDHGLFIFNATPVILDRTMVINASAETASGKELALRQAAAQFKMYTDGLDLPIKEIRAILNIA